LSRPRALPAEFVAPCLPSKAPQPPSGALWLHEIKHDGFRVIARKTDKRVRLYSRQGNDLTWRFPLVVEALAALRSRSCIIDGEAVACGHDGIADFERIRYRHNDDSVFLYAFDLIELDGDDLRPLPLTVRKTRLANVIERAAPALRLNEHLDEDGPLVFEHACKLGLEGIVSKRKDSRYTSGRSPHWIKSKNPNAPAVKREAEEDWGSRGEAKMTKKTKRGRNQDRKLISGGQDWEVRYVAKKTGRSKDAVKRAIKHVGHSRKKVEAALRRKK